MPDRNDKLKTCPHCGGAKFRINIITGGLMTCPTCDGTGEIEDKKQSNFERIISSPEALAEFICQAFYQDDGRYNSFQQDIEDEYCYERNHYEYGDREQVILDWLKRESDSK
ncbi:MAG: hypothetical protein IJ601_07390 [Acidaminococcaceae bacterium]|nr:hypothetical protein [Acidaminococcaceae bacterium]